MTPRESAGWQITLADLSLILFATTASAAVQQKPATNTIAAGVPLTVAAHGDLQRWIAQQPRDPRQRLTITATFAPGHLDDAIASAQQLAGQALRDGRSPRIVIEPGRPGALAASLAFDQTVRSPS